MARKMHLVVARGHSECIPGFPRWVWIMRQVQRILLLLLLSIAHSGHSVYNSTSSIRYLSDVPSGRSPNRSSVLAMLTLNCPRFRSRPQRATQGFCRTYIRWGMEPSLVNRFAEREKKPGTVGTQSRNGVCLLFQGSCMPLLQGSRVLLLQILEWRQGLENALRTTRTPGSLKREEGQRLSIRKV